MHIGDGVKWTQIYRRTLSSISDIIWMSMVYFGLRLVFCVLESVCHAHQTSICCPRFLCVWTRPFLLLLCNACLGQIMLCILGQYTGNLPHTDKGCARSIFSYVAHAQIHVVYQAFPRGEGPGDKAIRACCTGYPDVRTRAMMNHQHSHYPLPRPLPLHKGYPILPFFRKDQVHELLALAVACMVCFLYASCCRYTLSSSIDI